MTIKILFFIGVYIFLKKIVIFFTERWVSICVGTHELGGTQAHRHHPSLHRCQRRNKASSCGVSLVNSLEKAYLQAQYSYHLYTLTALQNPCFHKDIWH